MPRGPTWKHHRWSLICYAMANCLRPQFPPHLCSKPDVQRPVTAASAGLVDGRSFKSAYVCHLSLHTYRERRRVFSTEAPRPSSALGYVHMHEAEHTDATQNWNLRRKEALLYATFRTRLHRHIYRDCCKGEGHYLLAAFLVAA